VTQIPKIWNVRSSVVRGSCESSRARARLARASISALALACPYSRIAAIEIAVAVNGL
jgi:hypothetical protein